MSWLRNHDWNYIRFLIALMVPTITAVALLVWWIVNDAIQLITE